MKKLLDKISFSNLTFCDNKYKIDICTNKQSLAHRGEDIFMFGHRSDGRRIKTLPSIFKIMPSIMLERNDSQVLYKQDIPIKYLDEYIDNKAKDGTKFSYMHIIYAAIVRVIAERPQLNRFVMNGTTYARNKIYVSLAIKKNLTDDGVETTTKVEYQGTENIFDVKQKLDAIIEQNKDIEANNETDKLAKALGLIPIWLIKFAVGFLKFLDRHGLLPKAVIKASPFHTSVFLTNVGSLGIDTIYHHLYNFGTTSMFFSMGKKKKSFIYEDEEIKEEKCITIAFVGDERICDGYYYANSFKTLFRYLKKPELLETAPDYKQDVE